LTGGIIATESERELNCTLLFSGMAGVLAEARLSADPKQRNAILQRAREFYTSAFCSWTFCFFFAAMRLWLSS